MVHFIEAPCRRRDNLGYFLTFCGLVGTAVEVGAHRGEFSRRLLDTWPGVLHCVDPWADPPGYEQQAIRLAQSLGGNGNRDDDFNACLAIVQEFGKAGRCALRRGTSAQAAPSFPDSSLDFVYLDGDHRYEHVLADLVMWWPKVKPGGVLGGHDIVTPAEAFTAGWGSIVTAAVTDFVNTLPRAVPVYLVPEDDLRPWSFLILKPAYLYGAL